MRSDGETESQSDQSRVGVSVLDSADTSVKALSVSPSQAGRRPSLQSSPGVGSRRRCVWFSSLSLFYPLLLEGAGRVSEPAGLPPPGQ